MKRRASCAYSWRRTWRTLRSTHAILYPTFVGSCSRVVGRRPCGASCAKGSPRFFLTALRHRDRSSPWEAVLGYGRVLARVPIKSEPPARLMTALVRTMFNPEAGTAPFTDNWCSLDLDVLGVALQEAAQHRHRMAAFVLHEFVPLLQWAFALRRRLDANQRRAGWAWMQAQVRRWQAREARRRRRGPTWVSLLPTKTIGQFELTPLQSDLALWDEGVAMRHCVGRYTEDCCSGELRVFSATELHSGKRVATIALQWTAEGWQIYAVRGYANADPPARVVTVAARLAKLYSASSEFVGHVESNAERLIP